MEPPPHPWWRKETGGREREKRDEIEGVGRKREGVAEIEREREKGLRSWWW